MRYIWILLIGVLFRERLWAADVPPKFQGVLTAKVLKYDRNLEDRVKQTIVIGFVFSSKNEESRSHENNFFEPFSTILEKQKIKNMEVEVKKIDLASQDLAKVLEDKKISNVYISKGIEEQVLASLEKLPNKRVLSFAGIRSMGICVSYELIQGKPKIFVNMDASKKAGAEFDARFLRAAEKI
ncbi:YfiR family protein [Pseudobacteriovorax antillogorgiicola]|nr:YfiR family protein [Pseudobacteriovorax antillogorgiicola]